MSGIMVSQIYIRTLRLVRVHTKGIQKKMINNGVSKNPKEVKFQIMTPN